MLLALTVLVLVGQTLAQTPSTFASRLATWRGRYNGNTQFTGEPMSMCDISLTSAPGVAPITYPLNDNVPATSNFTWYFQELASGAIHYNMIHLRMTGANQLSDLWTQHDGFVCPMGSHLINRWPQRVQTLSYRTEISLSRAIVSDRANGTVRARLATDRDIEAIGVPTNTMSYCPAVSCLAEMRPASLRLDRTTTARGRNTYIRVYENGSANLTLVAPETGIKTELIMCDNGHVRHTIMSVLTGRYEQTHSVAADTDRGANSCKDSGMLFDATTAQTDCPPNIPFLPPRGYLFGQITYP